MNTNTLHTPLEVLLFFQSLKIHGVDNASFGRISDSLNQNRFIQQHDTYDANRLSPDSLQALYLQLLKEEIRSERNLSTIPGKDGEQSSKKRKLSTPPLQTVGDAAEHKHLIPRLVNRLYAQYRAHAVQVISEEERRYKELAQEIEEIEEGKWDARLETEAEPGRKASKGVSSISTLLRDESAIEVNGAKGHRVPQESEQVQEGKEPPTAIPNGHALLPTGQASAPNPSIETPLDDAQKPGEESTSRVQSPSNAQNALPSRQDTSQGHARFTPQSQVQPTPTPSLRAGVSPVEHPRPYAGVPSVAAPAAASPRPQSQGPISQGERTSGSPIILPPPPGMLRSSGSPAAPSHSLPMPTQGQVPPLPPPPTIPQPRGYAQRSYPYYDPQTTYAPSYSHYGAPPIPPYPPPPQGQIPPYATPPPGGYRPTVTPSGTPQYQPAGHFGTFQSGPPTQLAQRTPMPSQFQLSQVPHITTPTTPLSRINDKPGLQGLPPIDTSVSSTKWKTSSKNVPKEAQKSPVPPDRSPYLPSSPSPSPEPEPFRLDTRKDTPSRTETPTRGRGRGRWGGRGNRGRGGRGGPVPSPALATPKDIETRSQSAASNAEDTPTEAITARTRFKAEPPATPLQATTDATSLVSTPLAESSSRPTRRNRDTHLRTIDNLPTPRTAQKRKRGATVENEPTPDRPTPTPSASFSASASAQPTTRPSHVLASRNFPRVVSVLLNDIQSHKLASLFAKPITERDAPGYRDLVYQPQDLKSVRSAISAGSRFIAGLAEGGSTEQGEVGPGSPAASPAVGSGSSKTGTIWVERSADVTPPKAIVNSAQLEKELCRVFANAVMFNPDPKRGFGPAFKFSSLKRERDERDDEARPSKARRLGNRREEESEEDSGSEVDDGDDEFGAFVRDAREMFGDVERSVAAWRRAERVSEDAGAAGAGKIV